MVAAELRECAETICGIDIKMQGIPEQIEDDEGYGCKMD